MPQFQCPKWETLNRHVAPRQYRPLPPTPPPPQCRHLPPLPPAGGAASARSLATVLPLPPPRPHLSLSADAAADECGAAAAAAAVVAFAVGEIDVGGQRETGGGGVVDSPVRRWQNVWENRTGDCCYGRVLCQRPAAVGQADPRALLVHTRFVASRPADSSSGPKHSRVSKYRAVQGLHSYFFRVSIWKLQNQVDKQFFTNHVTRKRTRVMFCFSHGLIRLVPGKARML
jgi:hypothetical protein